MCHQYKHTNRWCVQQLVYLLYWSVFLLLGQNEQHTQLKGGSAKNVFMCVSEALVHGWLVFTLWQPSRNTQESMPGRDAASNSCTQWPPPQRASPASCTCSRGNHCSSPVMSTGILMIYSPAQESLKPHKLTIKINWHKLNPCHFDTYSHLKPNLIFK